MEKRTNNKNTKSKKRRKTIKGENKLNGKLKTNEPIENTNWKKQTKLKPNIKDKQIKIKMEKN